MIDKRAGGEAGFSVRSHTQGSSLCDPRTSAPITFNRVPQCAARSIFITSSSDFYLSKTRSRVCDEPNISVRQDRGPRTSSWPSGALQERWRSFVRIFPGGLSKLTLSKLSLPSSPAGLPQSRTPAERGRRFLTCTLANPSYTLTLPYY